MLAVLLWAHGLGVASAAADPWGRPEHLRAVPVPLEAFDDRAKNRPVRVFWDGTATATVAVLQRGRFRVVGRDVPSGFTTRPLPPGARIRVRLDGAERWSEVLSPDPVDDPLSLGAVGQWGRGADVVGDLAIDDATGTLWASSVGGGLLMRPLGEGSQWRVLGRADGLPDARVLSVSAAGGRVLAGTARGAVLLEDGVVVSIRDSGLPDSYVQAVHLEADGSQWLGTFHGLVHLAADGTTTPVLGPWSVFSLSAARGGGVFVGYEGLRHVSDDLTVTEWAPELHVYGLVDTPDGPVGATTEHGLVLFEGPERAVGISAIVDRQAYDVDVGPGGLWTAAGGLGLVMPDDTLLGRGAGLPSDGVRSVLALPDARVLVGTDAGLAAVLPTETGLPVVDLEEGGGRTRWPARLSLSDAVAVGDAGVWIAGERGLAVLGRPHKAAHDLVVAAGSNVAAVVPDDAAGAWAVSDRVVHLDRRGDLSVYWPPARLTCAAEVPGGGPGLYAGGPDGLWRLDVARDRFVPVSRFRDVVALSAGERGLWVADGSSVFRVVGSAVQGFVEVHPALDLAAAPDGVWVGSQDGLERIVLGGEDAVVEDVLGEADAGVRVTAVAAAPDGVWFAGEDGTIGRVAGTRWGARPLPGPDVPEVTALVPDGDQVWVATTAGMYRVWLPEAALEEERPGG